MCWGQAVHRKSLYLPLDFAMKLNCFEEIKPLKLLELNALDEKGGWCGWRTRWKGSWRGREVRSCIAFREGCGLHLQLTFEKPLKEFKMGNNDNWVFKLCLGL